MPPSDWQKWVAGVAILMMTLGGSLYLRSSAQPMITLYVPQTNLPAYRLISLSDLTPMDIAIEEVASDSLRGASELIGRYTIRPLAAAKPILPAQLGPTADERFGANTTAVAVPATAAMTYNGQLASGDIMTVWKFSSSGELVRLMDEVLVLDVQKVEGQDDPEAMVSSYIIVVAVPHEKQAALLTAVAEGSLLFSLNHQ